MDKTAIQAGAPPTLPPPGETTGIAPGPPPGRLATTGSLRAPKPLWRELLEPIASLKLTVALFALSIVLVFYGTWAQVDQGIWYVVSRYFRSFYVWIPVKVLLFHKINSNPFSILFPGGWLLGSLLMTNLLAAHALRFKMTWRRSGIFILHAGIIVMMLSEFITGVFAVEGVMQIVEGGDANYVQHPHNPELAIVDVSDPAIDDTVAIPASILRRGSITDENLPFDIEVSDYMVNSVEVRLNPDKANAATAGLGKEVSVRAAPPVSGTDPKQSYDEAAAYVTLKDKATGKAIDTYLVRLFWPEQRFQFGDKSYEIALRPKRSYRPFSIHLDKAQMIVWPGISKPKDFSSFVRILDEQGKEIRSARIYMNHPLYFNGETYFQAQMDMHADRQRMVTGLQVVYDPGKWIPLGLPILSCIMVGVGMLVHFGIHLIEFLQRRTAL